MTMGQPIATVTTGLNGLNFDLAWPDPNRP